jgi:hypothetical protein
MGKSELMMMIGCNIHGINVMVVPGTDGGMVATRVLYKVPRLPLIVDHVVITAI